MTIQAPKLSKGDAVVLRKAKVEIAAPANKPSSSVIARPYSPATFST